MTLLSDLETPSVTILMDRLETNIQRAQALVDAQGLANRPHIKTHKIPAIGRMQMEAGAIGLTCQKLGEVETFIDAGVTEDILLTFNIVGQAKTDRLMDLAGRIRRLAVVADNEAVVRGLSDAGRRSGRDVRLLIECDTGFGRNGVQSPEAALDLARFALGCGNIGFEGLMTFPNKGPVTAEFFNRAIELFSKAGITLPVLSGGGSPALLTLADFPMMTEHRAGTYVYNDVMMVESGLATFDQCAMHVRTTVVSRPTENRAIVDAGSKVLTRERYFVKNFGHVVEYPEAVVVNVSEEHGMIDLSASSEKPAVGEVINIVPNHCCVVSNMVDEVYGVRDGDVEVVWPVAARGKVR
jgi:D-serine deaminase-like pyridoxal phosphate-dependent protein